MEKGSVERMLLSGFGAILTVFALLGGLAWHSTAKSIEATKWVAHTHDVLSTLDQMMTNMFRAEAGQRGYVISGMDIYLKNRDESLLAVDDAIRKTAQLVGDNSSQQPRLEMIKQILAKRVEIFRHIQDVRANEGLLAVARQFGLGPGVMTQMQDAVNQMAEEEHRLLRERKADEASQMRVTRTSFGVLALVLLAVLFSLFWLIRRDNRLRHQTGVALQQSEALLRQILDLLPVAVFVADAKGTVTMINPASHKMWAGAPHVGIDRYGEYKGRRLDTGKEIAADEWAMARAVTKGETSINEEIEIQCFDHSRKIILLTAVPLRDAENKIIGGVAVCQDITEIKHTEQELRAAAYFDETRSHALALFNASFDRKKIFDGLLALLADKHPFPVSALYSHDDWSGKFVCEAAWGLPGGVTREFASGEGLLGQAAQAGRTIVLDVAEQMPQLTIQTGVFECRPAQVLIVPVEYQERRLAVLVLAATRAISENEIAFIESLCAQLGIALHNLKLYGDTKLLADQLRIRSEEITRKNAELEEASKMKSEFLANMSHELRTPLNAIIGFSEVLKDGLVGELAAGQREYIGDIFSSGQHLLALINDILDLSKVEAGKMTLDLEPVDVSSLLTNGLSIVKEKAFAQRIHLELEAAEDLGTIQADARKAKQIVYNLLSNAVKFSAEGGQVTLRVSRVPRADVGKLSGRWPGRSFPLADNEYPEFIEIRVTDSGIGIPHEGLERLFQPFSQIDGGLARKFEGTGLGLAMVRRLAELHGGTAAVESAEGQGACFIVWLPLRPAEAAAITVSVSSSGIPAALSGERWALVVEDDDHAAELIRRQLEAEGLKVLRTASAEAALDLATQQPLELITLDIMLPGMDGWEFLTRIKQLPELARIPVVIISIVADGKKGISLGAAAVLEKPVSHRQLHVALTDLGLYIGTGRTLTMLVVDDDPKAVEIIAAHLPHPDYAVLRAYGGREAIEAARRQLPDLIVLDLMMPEVSGFDVVEKLKDHPDTAQIPILIVTAKHITADDRATLNGHVLKIVEKSEFNHGRFLIEVRRALTGQGRS